MAPTIIEHHRRFLKLMMLYNILHDLVDVSVTFTPLLTPTCGLSQHYTPFARTDTYLDSFLPSTINLWNSLPNSLVALHNMDDDLFCTSSLQTNFMYNYLCIYTLVSFYTVIQYNTTQYNTIIQYNTKQNNTNTIKYNTTYVQNKKFI